MRITILSGVPGSGKSTYTKKFPDALVVSADRFFINEKGEYNFDVSLLGEAHKQCMRAFLEAVNEKADHIIVDNTNISTVEIAPYYSVGLAMEYAVEIVEINPPLSEVMGRNVHGVPDGKVRQMYKRLSTRHLPSRWNVTKV